MAKKIHYSTHEDVTIFYDMYLGEDEINDYLKEAEAVKVSDGTPVTAEEVMKIIEDSTNGIDSDIEITEKNWENPHKLYEDSFSGYLEGNIYDYESDRETNDGSYEDEISIIGD